MPKCISSLKSKNIDNADKPGTDSAFKMVTVYLFTRESTYSIIYPEERTRFSALTQFFGLSSLKLSAFQFSARFENKFNGPSQFLFRRNKSVRRSKLSNSFSQGN